jgi:hypothetical protein
MPTAIDVATDAPEFLLTANVAAPAPAASRAAIATLLRVGLGIGGTEGGAGGGAPATVIGLVALEDAYGIGRHST